MLMSPEMQKVRSEKVGLCRSLLSFSALQEGAE